MVTAEVEWKEMQYNSYFTTKQLKQLTHTNIIYVAIIQYICELCLLVGPSLV